MMLKVCTNNITKLLGEHSLTSMNKAETYLLESTQKMNITYTRKGHYLKEIENI